MSVLKMYNISTACVCLMLCIMLVKGNTVLNVTGIRLAEGSGPFEGRVEVSVNGIWGTICHNSFDMNDARVLCRMMGLSATRYFTGAHFGQGTGPVFAQELRCSGFESHIGQCSYVPNVHCSHSSDVGIMCTACGEIVVTNGKIESVSSNGTILTTSCNSGYTSNSNTSAVCVNNGTWSVSAVFCLPPGYPLDISGMRLANGVGIHDGRIELLVNDTWGTLCGSGFSSREARTVCKMFGYSGAYTYSSYYSPYGWGNGTIHLSNLDCTGTESHINNCTYSTKHSCSHYSDASVVCYFDLNVTDIRLVNGTGPYDGRVELLMDNKWGTVCNRYINTYDATTICKMLDLKFTAFFKTALYGSGTGPVYIGSMSCYSYHNDINDCYTYPPRRQYCDHTRDLSLICTECGEPDIINAVVSSFNGTVLVATCLQGYLPDKITLRCLENGTWLGEERCTLPYEYPLNITEVRLYNGYGPYEGTVQLKVNNTWGTVCGRNFPASAARVICRMLGYQYKRYYQRSSSQRVLPEYVDQLQCNGSEVHINNCSYEIPYTCIYNDYFYSAFVECTGFQLNITGVRVKGTPGPYHGRVEIEVNKTWGTICDNNIYSTEARVICGMLGLEMYTYYRNAYYGQGSGPVYIDKLDCPSSQSHINDCKYITQHTCNHRDDISVVCYGPKLNITDVRLANGTGPYDGRAEIKVNNTWGTICDRNFNINDADTFCNMLGLKGAQFFTGARHGEGSGPIYVDEFFCDSMDTDLSNCSYLFQNSCKHDRDISVVCNECGQPDIYYWDVGYFSYNGTTLYADCSYYKTYIGTLQMTCDNVTKNWITEGQCQEYSYPLDITEIRLAGGNRTSHGRVELKVMDTWGTICDHGFRIEAANTICSMIGYSPAFEVYSGAYFGEGKGPIFVDDLICFPGAVHINNCTYVTYDNCQHSNDVSVVCTDCGDPKPLNGFINSTKTSYGTVVKVTCNEGFKLVGNSVIKCELSNSWSDSPTCKLIDCGDPTPEHGSSNATSTTNGSIVMVACDTGYNLSGNALITCNSSEMWTDYPICEIVDCGLPSPQNAEVTLPGNKTTYGEIAVISCLLGYQPDGSSTVSCLANGTWESWPSCEIIDCGDPTPDKGQSNDTKTTYGTVISITCDEGMNISGNSTIICQADGTWSDTPVCDSSDCGLLSVSHGIVNISDGTTTGSLAYVTCNQGYKLKGSPIVVCTSAGWNDSVSCIKIDCGDPTPENGKIVENDGTDYGSVAKIECNVGHELLGDKIITCQEDGMWSDSPNCNIRDCGQPTPLPENAYWDDSEGTTYNASMKFVCDDGFLLVGEETIVCQSTGVWSSDPPACFEKADIGGQCFGDEYCHTRDAVCVNSVCACKSNIHDARTNKCDTMPILPYGQVQDDLEIHSGEVCGSKITFAPGIPLFDRLHKDLYVCSNGIISFGSKYINPTPPSDRDSVSSIEHNAIIAPFFSPIDKNTGKVFYRSYDILNSNKKIEDDKASQKSLIVYLEKVVKIFGGIDKFDTSFALLATWDSVKTNNTDYDKTKTSTFQLVLISDGTTTYTLFIYGQGLMQWRHKGASFPNIWVGYTISASNIYTHPYSFFPNVLGLDTVEQSLPVSYIGVTGVVFKPLTNNMVPKPNYAVECIKWYNDNLEEKHKHDIIASRLPDCPCDIWLSRFDPWFWNIRRWLNAPYTCVNMFPGQIYRPYGKSCCYDLSTWLWTDRRPVAGSFFRYHPNHYTDHYKHDIYPQQICCELSNYCNLFYDLRPTGACYRHSPYDFGIFWGDPHFRTLDGLNFTFNGLGEYTLLQLKTENLTFDLQARTERALKKDGTLSDATVFSAFSAKESSGASVHVELNKAKTGINLYGNNVDLTELYMSHTDNKNPFSYVTDDENLVISKRDETLSVLFPLSGLSLNISASVEMLSLNTIVPQTLRNRTTGLLGNYDGNFSNDYMFPNGTVLDANISERQVFSYGMTWAINPNNSAFVYNEGKSHYDHHNSSYVPRFLDEVDPAKRTEAEKACNGSQNIECIFDLVFTEKAEIAEEANRIKGQADSTRSEMDETVPFLKGCDTVNATKGENVTCSVTIENGSRIQFIENNVSATFDPVTSTITYIQLDESPTPIRFSATNEKGRSSPSFIVSVLLCTGCSGRGYCTDVPREDPRETDYFKYATCVCQPQYEGLDCEKDFDGCSANPCSLGRNCINLPASKQTEDRTFLCERCPSGFVPNNDYHDECFDINECDENVCEHSCTNTEGGFECSCNIGYRVDGRNSSACRDINECDEAIHNCSHACNNTDGSFSCQCFPGYTLNDTTWECVASSDGKCPTEETQRCDNTDGCINENGTYNCFCVAGYELDETGRVCKDIDECKSGVCPQECLNTNGSFECSCFVGYQLQGPTTCKKCEVPYWGLNCTSMCDCTGQGADRCDPVKGCICATGWTGDKCNIDIDECQLPVDICQDPRKKCDNNLGSYRCICTQGYIESSSGVCEDFNECSNPLTNECMQLCTNTIGGYTCGCRDGFTTLNRTHCKDINECELDTAGCEQVCKNSPGLYSCYCHFGYTLNDDRKTCSKISDPCKTKYELECEHYCVENEEEATCRCQKGYMLANDNRTCLDINECKHTSLNLCAGDAECINIEGSFSCKCPVGARLENDGRTCSVCDEFHYGENCSQNCSCLHGRCDHTLGCVCEHGWGGPNCDIDRNECETEELVCDGDNIACLNTPGSAICSCLIGFSNVSGICGDINECKNASLNSCDQECINTIGSYTCKCQKGFVYQEERCTDMNECLHSDQCDQICENTVGSYRCLCEAGFRLNLTDRKSCIASSECSEKDEEDCNETATCFVIDGKPSCSCKKGYSKVEGVCTDINECNDANGQCSQHCNNTIGGYTCNCNAGFYLMTDGITCQECHEGQYGHECKSNCSCVPLNTASCDKVNGTCNCKQGWRGDTCSDDINECNTSLVCPNNSKCENIQGGYECKCYTGFFKTGTGNCKACDLWNYGENCIDECKCVTKNTINCSNVDGTCACKVGWQGNNCSENIDECASNNHTCKSIANSQCKDTDGSYNCICNEGFDKQGDSCTDINECLLEHNCEEVCVNTAGSYHCKCLDGFWKPLNVCLPCTSNTFGENCSKTCSCNVHNSISQTCNTVTGQCTCFPNWQGDNCNDDVNECEDRSKCKDEQNKECRNTMGWYTCECVNGYKEDSNGQCMLQEVPIMIDLTVKIEIPETIDINNTDTKSGLKESLYQFYANYTNAKIVIHITRIREHNIQSRTTSKSVSIDYTVAYNENDISVASKLTAATIDLGKGVVLSFTVGNCTVNVTVTADSYNDMEPCEIYIETVGNCGDGYECVIENSDPICRLTSSGTNLLFIIGVSAGGFFLLMIIVIVIMCLRKQRQNRKKENRSMMGISSASDLERKLNSFNPRPSNIYNQLDWQNFTGTGAKDSEESMYMTWKSKASRFTMSSGNNTAYNQQQFQIPRARMQPTPFSNPDYINPRT